MSSHRPDANDVLQKIGPEGLRRQLDTKRAPYILKPANFEGEREVAERPVRQTRRKNQERNWREWSITAAALQCKVFPEVAWILPGILPEGLALLAGRPKVGKSWLALDVVLGVGSGDCVMGGIRPACSGDVLYLALEDNPRRLQNRCTKLRGALKGKWPDRVTLATDWRRLDQGGLEDLIEWCGSVEQPRLIVIDTLQKVKPVNPKKPNSGYAEDYQALEPIQKLAGERGIAILVLTHVRKQEAEDPLDTVSGTLGVSGCADTILVIDRTAKGTTLHGRGRDIETLAQAMQFDTGICQWRLLGDAAEVQRSKTSTAIMDALAEDKKSMTPKEIADATGLSSGQVKQRLRVMVKNGEALKLERAFYAHCDYVPPVTIVTSVPERGPRQHEGYDSYDSYGPPIPTWGG